MTSPLLSQGPLGIEWAWLAPAVCIGAFLAISLFGRYLPGRGSFLAIGAIGFGFLLFWFVLRDLLVNSPGDFRRTWFAVGDDTFVLGMTIDQLAVLMMGVVTFVSLAVQIYSLGYMKGESRKGWYFAVHSLFAAAMLGLVLSNNLLLLYISWELVGLCSYLLIGFWYERRPAAEAAKKAFITTRIGDVGLLIAILVLFKQMEPNTFDIPTILAAAQAGDLSSGILSLTAVLIFMGAMGKSAQVPFHVWLPDAMEGPSPVSALIHAATMVVAGVYLVARMLPLFEAAPGAMELVVIVGLITAIVGASMALVMTDLKRILAYSTISQIGFMMLALGAGGLSAGMFHLVTHAFFKSLLFLGAGSILHAVGQRHDMDIRKLGGLWRKMPLTSALFILAALALAGLPPLSGFWSKDEILQAVWQDQNPVILVFTLGAALLSALYMARLCFIVFFGPLKPENADVHESPAVFLMPLAALGALTLVIGFTAPDWLDNVLRLPDPYTGFTSFLIGAPDQFHRHVALAATGSLIALAGIGAGWAIYHRKLVSSEAIAQRLSPVHRLLVNKYYLDDLYQAVIDRVVLVFSDLVARFDRTFINDAGVDGSGRFVTVASRILRLHETGQISNYILAIVLGSVIFILAITLSA
ncbi:MAG: NADH-quinone oxidoreductase subunit L [Chloroflexi bacterium]|nr:NADH-quinone oxidoreductase subunit L [Chloroflexota bacterium]